VSPKKYDNSENHYEKQGDRLRQLAAHLAHEYKPESQKEDEPEWPVAALARRDDLLALRTTDTVRLTHEAGPPGHANCQPNIDQLMAVRAILQIRLHSPSRARRLGLLTVSFWPTPEVGLCPLFTEWPNSSQIRYRATSCLSRVSLQG